jgi:riboflavin biosynthesis pyrimidine reductase
VNVTRVFPGPCEDLDLDDVTSRDTLLDWYRPPSTSWLRLNLIASVDGNAAGTDGTSQTLTSRTDRKILGVIRELADVVLIGANSVRREGYLLPRRSRLAIVTATGDLTGHRFEPATDREKVIVLCPARARSTVERTLGKNMAHIVVLDQVPIELGPNDRRTDDLVSGTNSVDDSVNRVSEGGRPYVSMPAVVAALEQLGLTSIVCEGGPRLAGQLLSAGLVDEACFSTSPLIGGTPLQLLDTPLGTEKKLELSQLLIDNVHGIYARWLISTPHPV